VAVARSSDDSIQYMLCTFGVDDIMFVHNRPDKGDAGGAYTRSDSPGTRTEGKV